MKHRAHSSLWPGLVLWRVFLGTLLSGGLSAACQTGAHPSHPSSRASGRAHAGKITETSELLSGSTAMGRVGDFRIANDRAVFIIDRLGQKQGFAASGGNLIDIGVAPGFVDAFNQTFLYLNDTFPRQPVWTTLDPYEREDGTAGIVVTGSDINNPELFFTHDYHLEPDASSLLLRTKVKNRGRTHVGGYAIGDAMQWGKSEHFAAGLGFDMNGKRPKLDWVFGLSDKVSYGIAQRAGTYTAISGSSWTDVIADVWDLAPGAEATYERYFLVGVGDTSSIYREIARRRDLPCTTVTGRVTVGPSKTGVGGAEVWLEQAGKPMALARTQADGSYRATVPKGAYSFRVETIGSRQPSGEARESDQDFVYDVNLQPGGTFRFHVTENGKPAPGKVAFYSQPNPKLGSSFTARGAGNVSLTPDGEGVVQLPVGQYRVFATRGIEYDVEPFDLVVESNKTYEHTFALRRVVDTRGYLSGDFHQHAANSYDSAVSLVDRVTSNMAEGVEILVGTDHDFVSDYTPALNGSLGHLVWVPGVEATTHTIGHFMGFPMQVRTHLPRNGAPETFDKTAREIFAGLRSDPADKVIQANHPRSGGTGYFDMLSLDEHDPLRSSVDFDYSFDAIEVLNGKRIDEAEKVLHDWMNFYAQGRRYTMTGNSDSHVIVFGEIGYPRNFVRMSENLTQFSQAEFVAAVKQKRAVMVSLGPYIELFAGDASSPAQIGDTLHVKKNKQGVASVEVRFKLQAAPWVDVDQLEFWQDGKRVHDLAVPPSQDPVRLVGAVRLDFKANGYVFALARGDRAMEPVLPTKNNKPTRPFAFTNPIVVEVEP